MYKRQILGFIRGLCKEKQLTALTVLHDLNLAAQYCDRLALISNGQLHAVGTPHDVITEKNVSEVYGANVSVYPHPVNNLPTILITPVN